jgi:hypothetical protein
MVSVALVQRPSAELFLSSEIHAFIAQHLKVDVASMDAHSHLTEDFGLDLFEITALLTVLETIWRRCRNRGRTQPDRICGRPHPLY